jgi:hydrocephalus-inducing protein
MLLKEIVNSEGKKADDFDDDYGDDSEDEESEIKALAIKKQKKAELILSRKYKTIRKAIEDDLFLF